MSEHTFNGFEPANTTPVPDVCWICGEKRWHWKKERPDGLCRNCSGDLTKVIVRNRKRARDKGIDATLTLVQWVEILHNSQGICFYCTTFVGYRSLTLEHVTPLAKGGGTTAENVVAACLPCNVSKNIVDVVTWKKKGAS